MAKFGTFFYASANLYTAIAFFQGALYADHIEPTLYKTNDTWKWYALYLALTGLTWCAAVLGKVNTKNFTGGKFKSWVKAFPSSFKEIMTLPTDVQRSDLAVLKVLDTAKGKFTLYIRIYLIL